MTGPGERNVGLSDIRLVHIVAFPDMTVIAADVLSLFVEGVDTCGKKAIRHVRHQSVIWRTLLACRNDVHCRK